MVRSGAILSAQLHGNGPIGQAFQKLTQAGCDAGDLEYWLTKIQSQLQIHPPKRSRSHFSVERRRKLGRIAAHLEYAAAELGSEAGMWIFTLGDLQGDILGIMRPLEALAVLRQVARITRNAIGSLGKVMTITASVPIAGIVEEVRRRTGRPHYEQMATLLGAACSRPQFSADDLKMLISRCQSR